MVCQCRRTSSGEKVYIVHVHTSSISDLVVKILQVQEHPLQPFGNQSQRFCCTKLAKACDHCWLSLRGRKHTVENGWDWRLSQVTSFQSGHNYVPTVLVLCLQKQPVGLPVEAQYLVQYLTHRTEWQCPSLGWRASTHRTRSEVF